MFDVGDKVSYPMHGAGVIEAIEEKTILNERKNYYVLRFLGGQMKVLIPVDASEKAGLRGIIPAEEVESVLRVFDGGNGVDDTLNWNKRFRENQDRLKTGDVYEVAGVIRALLRRLRERGLSAGEKRMLSQAMNILVTELSMASGLSPESIRQRITND